MKKVLISHRKLFFALLFFVTIVAGMMVNISVTTSAQEKNEETKEAVKKETVSKSINVDSVAAVVAKVGKSMSDVTIQVVTEAQEKVVEVAARQEAERIAAEEALAMEASYNMQEEVIYEEPVYTEPVYTNVYYNPSDLRNLGVVYANGWRYTWYSERVLPGGGLNIPGRYSDGDFVRDGEGYICCASSDLSFGSIVDTPWGTAKVYDCGCDSGTIDMYVSW